MTLQIGWLQLKLRTSFDPDEISSLLEQLHKIDKGKKHSEVCEESEHNVPHKSVTNQLNKTYLLPAWQQRVVMKRVKAERTILRDSVM